MKKVLVPIDFSKASKNAALFAAQLANKSGAYLLFLHVYRLPMENVFAPTYMTNHLIFEREVEAQKSFEKKMQEWLKDKPKVNFLCILKYGYPLDIIIQQAQEQDANLVIMGTKGADDVLDKIFGSITSSVIKGCDVPVLAIPPNARFENFKRIAYATNFDEKDIPTIKKLNAFVKELDIELEFIHITEKDTEVVKEGKEFIERSKANGIENMYLQELKNDNVINGLEEFIAKNKIDALATLTHSKSLFEKLIKGSITQKIALKNNVPLLAYH